MIVVKKHEQITTNSGLVLFIEQYHRKEWKSDVWFWRYGTDNRIWSDMLRTKPNKKKLVTNY